jgi:hypothetical protein
MGSGTYNRIVIVVNNVSQYARFLPLSCLLEARVANVFSGGASPSSARVHNLVIWADLTHQGALIMYYRGARASFWADIKVK